MQLRGLACRRFTPGSQGTGRELSLSEVQRSPLHQYAHESVAIFCSAFVSLGALGRERGCKPRSLEAHSPFQLLDHVLGTAQQVGLVGYGLVGPKLSELGGHVGCTLCHIPI